MEKKTENSLTPWDPCVEGKTMKLSFSPSIEHEPKSNNSGFTLNLSENLEHFQKSAAFDINIRNFREQELKSRKYDSEGKDHGQKTKLKD